jgi:hypothetical protein
LGGGELVVVVVVVVNVDVRRSVVRLRRRRSVRLVNVVLVMDTGTVVMFFFVRKTGLFFAVEVLSAGRLSVDRDRRVFTFPSGLVLGGKMELKLFVLCLDGLGLDLAVAICRGEDAERNGDAGLKVQIDDFWCERIFSFNLSDLLKSERMEQEGSSGSCSKQKSKGLG